MKKIAFVIVFVLFFVSFASQGITSNRLYLTKGQMNLLIKLHKKGLLKVNYKLNRAQVDPGLWRSMKYDLKKDFAAVLAIYCGNMKKTYTYWVDIYDIYSGKKLAEYSQAFGFKVFP